MPDYSWSTKEVRSIALTPYLKKAEAVDRLYDTTRQGKIDAKQIEKLVIEANPWSGVGICEDPGQNWCSLIYKKEGFPQSREVCEKHGCPWTPWCYGLLRRYAACAKAIIYMLGIEPDGPSEMRPYENPDSMILRCSMRCHSYDACQKLGGEDKAKACIKEMKTILDEARAILVPRIDGE